MVSEKVKREQDLRKQEQELDRKQRVEEARLASERKKIEERKVELAEKEKDASGTVRVSQGAHVLEKQERVPPRWE